MLLAVSVFLKASSFKQRGTVTGLHGSSIKLQAPSFKRHEKDTIK
jgi:hypothetical protein